MLWPFPLDPDAARSMRPTFVAFARAACAEVGVEVDPSGEALDTAENRAAVMRAQELAYISLGIAYEMIDPDEYARRRVALGGQNWAIYASRDWYPLGVPA